MIGCRPATLDEFPVAAQLRAEMGLDWGEDYDAAEPKWRARFCEYFAALQRDGRGQLFLTFDGETPVGMTIVSLRDEWRSYVFGTRFAFVNAVYVKPAYRRRGIGRGLMLRAIAWAEEKKCTRIRLRTSEEGRALYESVGFRSGREMERDL